MVRETWNLSKSLDVLHVYAWVLSGGFGFLPESIIDPWSEESVLPCVTVRDILAQVDSG